MICSRHFQPTDFERRFNFLPGQSLQFPRLKADEFGISVYPTVYAGTEQTPQSERSKRKVRILLWSDKLRATEKYKLDQKMQEKHENFSGQTYSFHEVKLRHLRRKT